MKVLVGVDGSSNSFAAVEFIGQLISPERDQLIMLFATPSLDVGGELDPAVEERARAVLSRMVLESSLERLPEAWRDRVEQRPVSGPASSEILSAVQELGVDLVVVGFRGTSSLWERFILGSVSRAIVQTAPVPVLVVKPRLADGAALGAEAVQHLRAMVAYDGTRRGDATITALWRFNWPEEAEGWVLTVVRPLFPFDLPDWVKSEPRDPDVAAMKAAWEEEHRQNVQAARAELELFQRKLPPIFQENDVVVVEGRPPEQIVSELRSKGIDLAVVGSRGAGRIETLLVGSTTEQVLASAPCSVLVVR